MVYGYGGLNYGGYGGYGAGGLGGGGSSMMSMMSSAVIFSCVCFLLVACFIMMQSNSETGKTDNAYNQSTIVNEESVAVSSSPTAISGSSSSSLVSTGLSDGEYYFSINDSGTRKLLMTAATSCKDTKVWFAEPAKWDYANTNQRWRITNSGTRNGEIFYLIQSVGRANEGCAERFLSYDCNAVSRVQLLPLNSETGYQYWFIRSDGSTYGLVPHNCSTKKSAFRTNDEYRCSTRDSCYLDTTSSSHSTPLSISSSL
jgi:hypothetical protein